MSKKKKDKTKNEEITKSVVIGTLELAMKTMMDPRTPIERVREIVDASNELMLVTYRNAFHRVLAEKRR